MITTKPRTLVVGATGLVWAHITEVNLTDLTASAVELRTVDPAGVVGAWGAPTVLDTSKAAVGVVRAAVAHTAVVVGFWELQAKVGTEIVKAGAFQVVAP